MTLLGETWTARVTAWLMIVVTSAAVSCANAEDERELAATKRNKTRNFIRIPGYQILRRSPTKNDDPLCRSSALDAVVVVGQALRLPTKLSATDSVALQFLFLHSKPIRYGQSFQS